MQPHSDQNGRKEDSGMNLPATNGLTWPAVDRRRSGAFRAAMPQGVYTARSVAAMIHRRRYPLAGAFLLVFAAACVLSLMMPKRYEAEAKLMIKRARAETPLTLERGAAAAVPADMTEAELSAEIELLRSRDLLEEVATACRLVAEKPSEDRREAVARAVRSLEKDLKILPVGKTNLIAVRYRSAEPELAAQVVNRLVEGYLRKHVAVHRTGDTAVFFKSQAENFQKELNEAQQQLAGFRNKDSVSDLPEQKSSALKRVSDLEAAVQEADSAIRDAENRARLLRQQQGSLPATIETGSRTAKSLGLIERLKGQLLELENKRTELLTKYEPGYRLVREVEKQIHDTRAALEREQSPSVVDRTSAPNPLRQSIEADLLRTEATVAGLRARRASLARDLSQSRGRLQRLDTLTGEHDDLQRRFKMAEENYLLYQKKEEESRLEDALDRQRILNVSVVEKATIPAEPAPRHRSVILVIGLLMACFGSLATAVVTDYFCQPPSVEAAVPSIRTRPLAAQSIPADAPEPQRSKRPAPAAPPKSATNLDRAAFVAAGLERLMAEDRQKPPALGKRAAEPLHTGADHRPAPAQTPPKTAPAPAPAAPKASEPKPPAPKPPVALPVAQPAEAPRGRVSPMRDRPILPPKQQAPAAPARARTQEAPLAPPAPLRTTASAPVNPGGRVSAAYRTLTGAAAPAMPPVQTAPLPNPARPAAPAPAPVAAKPPAPKPMAAPAHRPQVPSTPLQPSGFLGDFGGGSVRRLFDE